TVRIADALRVRQQAVPLDVLEKWPYLKSPIARRRFDFEREQPVHRIELASFGQVIEGCALVFVEAVESFRRRRRWGRRPGHGRGPTDAGPLDQPPGEDSDGEDSEDDARAQFRVHVSCASNVSAATRSIVVFPSVNQPYTGARTFRASTRRPPDASKLATAVAARSSNDFAPCRTA